MGCSAVSIDFSGPYNASLVADTVRRFHQSLKTSADFAFVFLSSDYLLKLEEFADIVRVDGHVVELVGCTSLGRAFNGAERESGSGFSLLAVHAPEVRVMITELSQEQLEGTAPATKLDPNVREPNGWIGFLNPFGLSVEQFLIEWNSRFPGIPMAGGLASGVDENMAVFRNNTIVPGLALGLEGPLSIVAGVSPGCRPIGEPLTVTRADKNVVYSLGSRPAYEALESAFQSLSDLEKAGAQGNLFAGLASSEYVDEFAAEHFLVRSILGADPASGAVVIGGIPRVGQTLQYQIRDSASADVAMRASLKQAAGSVHTPLASILFSCLERGSKFFGMPDHDAGLMEAELGDHPSVGFFCGGEIGPVAGKNCLHTHAAAFAVLVENQKRDSHV